MKTIRETETDSTQRAEPDADYLPVKVSQIYLLRSVALFCRAEEGGYVLYKKRGDVLDGTRMDDDKHPDLFIRKADKNATVRELVTYLNRHLADLCQSANLTAVRFTLAHIVSEAMHQNGETHLDNLPETIDILFRGYADRPEMLEVMSKIRTSASVVTDHIINVMLLTFRYCFHHQYDEKMTKQLALCALLHDIGTTSVDGKLLEKRGMLTDDEYEHYKRHTVNGHDMLKIETKFDLMTATVALEHHERIDGSGYPFGRANICPEGQLIGLIDCYEPLTYRDKTFRKARRPFDSLDLIKQEVLQGRFQKSIFRDFCSCLSE